MKSSSLNEKWGDEALIMGWTAIPSSLLMLQKTLGINSVALNVLLNLTASWWETAKTHIHHNKQLQNVWEHQTNSATGH